MDTFREIYLLILIIYIYIYIYIYIRDIRVILAEYKVPYIAATDTLSITASSIMNAYRRRGKKKRERERERKKAGGN